MKQFGSKLKKQFLDLIFPIKCISCGLEGDWLCVKCLDLVKLNHSNFCPICDVENSQGSVCGFCRNLSSLDGLIVVLENSRLNQKIIHLIKYNFIVDLLNYLKLKIVKSLTNNLVFRDYFVLVPIPLHRRRFLERGFNQSELICNLINSFFGNKINTQILKKIQYGYHQVGLGADSRRHNVVGSFKVDNIANEDFSKTIILVDDVYTTGSTISECAKVLKERGYQRVWGLVLLKG